METDLCFTSISIIVLKKMYVCTNVSNNLLLTKLNKVFVYINCTKQDKFLSKKKTIQRVFQSEILFRKIINLKKKKKSPSWDECKSILSSNVINICLVDGRDSLTGLSGHSGGQFDTIGHRCFIY